MAEQQNPESGAWSALRGRLQERLTMAREVLDEQGYRDVAALVPLEEVLIWMDELEAQIDGYGASDA